MERFLKELKRRKVFRVAIVYAAVAFVIVQVAELVIPALLLPEWTFRLIVLLCMLGMPIAIVLAWAFETTSEGVRPTPAATDRTLAGFSSRGLKWQALLTLVAIAAIIAGGWWALSRDDEGPSGRIDAIAVLPFVNLSAESGEEYFTDGMTEALISRLGKIEALTVISRTSVMRYADSQKSIPEIAAELRVDAVVEGAVLRTEDDQVRITATLIRAEPEQQLWSDEYVSELNDILTLQSDVAGAIARQVQVEVTPAEAEQLAESRRIDPEAYEAYLRGRHLWNQRNQESLLRAIELFERAVEIDSTYALAWSALADAFIVLPGHSSVTTAETEPRARAAARRAIALAPNLGEAHAALASVDWNDWRWDAVEPGYRRSIVMSPGYATAHQWYGNYLVAMGRYDEAIERLKRARELDPLSGIIAYSLAEAYFGAGRRSEAIAETRELITEDPTFYPARLQLISFYEHEGLLAEAIAEYEELSPDLFRASMGLEPAEVADIGRRALQEGGERAYHEAIARALESAGGRRGDVAEQYVLAGDRDDAFRVLDEMVARRGYEITNIKGDYRWELIRGDPRFAELLRQVGLEPS